jgi:hypothetical protein
VFLNDVEIVQQPISSWTDVEPTLRAAIQLMIDAIENLSRVLEAEQQRPGATLFLRRKQMMPARDCSRTFAEPLETEYFTANWADEFFAGSVSRTAEKTTQNCCWSLGRDCCCHVTYSTPEVCRSRVGHARKISRLVYSA